MAKFFVPDSVACEVHVREIPDRVIEGFPLMQQLALIDAFDRHNIDGEDMFEYVADSKVYREDDGIGTIEVDDGRDHYYGYVFGKDEALARKAADALLNEWLGDDEDEEDDDD